MAGGLCIRRKHVEENPMSRGMTPAILAMVKERARVKLRCMLSMRAQHPGGPASTRTAELRDARHAS